ncbi:hypothetical protein Pla52o_41360 [Novipirellula galeiformis]|uniref:Uncharacterized protein n=1 Tax=Novipirellula galeiformis TaxID=2528004 RepID=A0A5C6C8S2_9BACT|nr:hypothetical protein [Novipirellula galeiformis]TWU21103.1 hypothetical protein Pla52o_41360 [Novipirellula galeiformis]
MHVNPTSAASSIAGTARAAARGGEADAQNAEATQRHATTENPGGKTAATSAIDSSESTHDRGGDGRQMYDSFEQSKEHTPPEPPPEETTNAEHDSHDHDLQAPSTPQEPPPHLDFNA